MFPNLDVEVCPCGCMSSTMLAWHALMQEVDPAAAMQARKDDKLDKESGTDAFMSEELGIALALSSAWAVLSESAKEKLLNTVATSYSPYEVQTVLDEVSVEADNLFRSAEPEVKKEIKSALSKGAKTAGSNAAALYQSPATSLTEEGLLKATRYYSNKYFRENIVPAIHKSIDKAISGTEVAPLADIQAAIAQHFKPVPYWNMVANVGASRGYHYGMLKSYEQLRVVGYRIVAVIDDRTSTICRNMNGREFLVTEAVHLMDGMANDSDPGAAKTRTPWLKQKDIAGMSSSDLAKLGFSIPPFHALCRTTVSRI